MGFFSWLSAKSKRSIPAYPHAEQRKELSEVVAVMPDNKLIIGVYDGYGRVDDVDILVALAEYYFGKPVERDEIFKERGDYDNILKMVKIVRQSEYVGESYDELPTSERCPHQGFFY